MAIERNCKDCGNPMIAYSTVQNRCSSCLLKRQNAKPRKLQKPIRQKGKFTLKYEKWRDTVARPYLIAKYGEVCAACGGARCGNRQLDVDHIKGRGSHPHLRMELSNVQLLGRDPCHREKTDGKVRV